MGLAGPGLILLGIADNSPVFSAPGVTRRFGLQEMDVRRHDDGRFCCQLRILVADDHHGRSDLLVGELGQSAFRSLEFIPITTTAASSSAC